MNRQTFLRYLEQPSLLSELPITELQGLALEYPYSANIRLLLLLKAKQEKHASFDVYLHRCAAAGFDRAQLFDVLMDVETTKSEKAEVLELLELEELELAPLQRPAEEQIPSRLNEAYVYPIEPEIEEIPEPEQIVEKQSAVSFEGWAMSVSAYLDALPTGLVVSGPGVMEDEYLRPEDPDEFSVTVTSSQKETSLSDRLRRLRQLQQRASGTEDLDRIVNRSVIDHGAVASETLAGLLVRQGQYQNAIKMYRRLILLYPEKKPIFAGLIKELKEKL